MKLSICTDCGHPIQRPKSARKIKFGRVTRVICGSCFYKRDHGTAPTHEECAKERDKWGGKIRKDPAEVYARDQVERLGSTAQGMGGELPSDGCRHVTARGTR